MKLKFTFLSFALALFAQAQKAPAYYSSINFTKTKNELKNDVAKLISDTHKQNVSYSAGLANLFKTSDADPQNPSNLLLMYGSQSSGTHQRSRSYSGSWNREHVYAKSKGTPNLGTSGPGSDGHHLRPADVTLNSTRGNLLFDDGIGVMATKTSRGGWYPGEEWKGDVARILMYMYVRYNSRALPLNITYGPSTYSSDFPDILLKWNVEDPVSQFEIQRNNVVANVQGNRNPFIDNPYLATVIWGGPKAQNTWPESFNGEGGSETDTEKPSTPTNLASSNITTTSVALTWTASTDNVAVSGYDIYVNNAYNSSVFSNNGIISGLASSTTYSFYVVAKDAAGNKSDNSQSIEVTTKESNPGGGTGEGTSCGTEDFENIPSTGSTPPASSYTDRTWTNRGIIWTATNARTDRQIYIDGDNNKAICIRKGTLKSSTISGGIGSLSVKTYLPFADSDGFYTLKINGEVKGQIPYSNKAKTTTIENINVEGDVVIELVDETSNNRVSFDNLSWTCYEKLGTNEIVKQNNKLVISPNPVKNHEFVISGIEKNETIQVFSINGELVQTIQNVNNNTKVRLNKLPKGVYIVKTKTQSSKVIIN
ncbi:endonuclease [Empedobacter tilapiae]|uniref:T9SS type A sorting domain-containing protein n=1 Tax=Empedobacter tilapiae TaxID=2491114 RepID=A0A4Z1BCW9_9FLAO|nr:endonuclease [Empedobacter tilapiae]TGN22980.1 T9SS type A sorting domain-containing protein [Empedobacter tilapiae]